MKVCRALGLMLALLLIPPGTAFADLTLAPATPCLGCWRPSPGLAWQMQLTGPLDASVAADLYTLDLFDTPANVVAALKTAGHSAVCYLDAGTYENWRPDAGSFPPSVLGAGNGWPG
ncbi:MAG TPA: endo alpha-1,4 polygalactosaminidase, partial [Chloroflexota bacterium]|nr:endo alpha-1,4 polygalactosaminidase [Chloroflexota bacterium]